MVNYCFSNQPIKYKTTQSVTNEVSMFKRRVFCNEMFCIRNLFILLCRTCSCAEQPAINRENVSVITSKNIPWSGQVGRKTMQEKAYRLRHSIFYGLLGCPSYYHISLGWKTHNISDL